MFEHRYVNIFIKINISPELSGLFQVTDFVCVLRG